MGESNNEVVVICLTLLVLTMTTMSKPSMIVTKLIHRNSLESPYYNPKATTAQLYVLTRKTSKSRLAYLSSRMTRNDDYIAGIGADPDGSVFLTNISIGDPPSPQLFIFDTGSNLMWLQCHPCVHCFKQSIRLFEPFKSNSFARVSCDSPFCPRCDHNDICWFHIVYTDRSTSDGVMATEKLTFQSSDTVDNVVIGCANNNSGYFGHATGILGLGAARVSLATHVGSRFSYCIGSIRNPSFSPSFLVLGGGSQLDGDTTRLEVVNSQYYLTVTGMSIDTKTIDIDPRVFKRSRVTGAGGVMIDSGCTLTYLASGVYEAVRREVAGMLDGVVERVERRRRRLCYKGVMERDLLGFPVVTIHFEGGAELGLDVHSLFVRQRRDEFCMAVEESEEDGLNVIGVLAQQHYNVGYDLARRQISFQRIDCDVYHKMLIAI